MADEWGYSLLRSYSLLDIAVRGGGAGREVEAYAAIYDQPYEVHDQHGHYMELIERSAFNRTLAGAGRNAVCLYNHGLDLSGRPDSMAQVPLGRTLEIRSDQQGLVTRTRYNDGAYADAILEAIRNGAIKSQSFRGAIYRSSPTGRIPRPRDGQPLPTVTRHELGLKDYGPTPVAMNPAEMILAVRSAAAAAEVLAALPQDEREELARMLSTATPMDPAIVTATVTETPGAEDPHPVHSGRLAITRARVRVAMISRGLSDG